jgi:peptide/nickel transport system substrate-binding protein
MGRARRHQTLGRSPVGSAGVAGPWTRRSVALGAAGLLAVAGTLAGCGTNSPAHAGNTPVNGGTATYALPANVTPNYIFPFSPPADFTIANLDSFQYYMYRPLYWFGDSGLPYLNAGVSLAYPPTYSGQLVTIKLKTNYKWTDGTSVNSKDVMFWMNMMQAEAQTNYGGFVPGGLPTDVKDVHAVGPYEVQMTIKGSYNPLWFTDNELSQITPLPLAWDRTGSNSPSDCADIVADCIGVFKYLNGLSANTSTWTSSLWRDVDGPWQLTGYSNGGTMTFSYNDKYDGPVPRDHIDTFIEEPFTSEQAEFNVLQAGGNTRLDVGYLPTVDAPVPAPGAMTISQSQNPVSGYRMEPLYAWGLDYIPYNFNPKDPQLAVFSQVYFRQAFQYLINQEEIVQGALHGYGEVTTTEVGDTPKTRYLSPEALKGDPYPFSPQHAKELLTSHGWRVNPDGTTTCANAGPGSNQCGAGIKAGTKLDFSMLYATGEAWVEAAVLQFRANAALLGIHISLTPGTFDQVVGEVENGCGTATVPKPCPWELADWGQGWSYQPDYLPTGDELFETGSAGNLGEYSNKHDDSLIKATLRTSNLQPLYRWEDYLTTQLPVILQPEAPMALVESVDNLRIGTLAPTLTLQPEDWYYVR